MGTRCEISCDRGYRLIGQRHVQCMANRHWSGTGFCHEIRCHTLQPVMHASYQCSNGVRLDSRCDYTCSPGYIIEGHRSRVCMEDGKWSGKESICVDMEPPKIKCPPSRQKFAETDKLTARVYWDKPIVRDTADGIIRNAILKGPEPGSELPEGEHIIRYIAYDAARNKAFCKFIVKVQVRRCQELKAPPNGHISCTSGGNNYGATCTYSCEGGYELRGSPTRVCLFNRAWAETQPICKPMEIKVDVTSVGAFMDQFYEKRHLLILSTPDASDRNYKLQVPMLQEANCGLDKRHVTVVELIGEPPRDVGRIKHQHLSTELVEQIRQAFRLSRSRFSIILVDKLGLDRERYIYPVTPEELFTYIDNYMLEGQDSQLNSPDSNACE
ncbi:sushi repeat-containing protein SRPX2 isoform X2 [Protopterus annectens]|nr:sushi repeat-containing protein SRPX2 isoform X2 [Protopterus annectens]XP_043913453.1 sushi repeat-containing protein SRPX2 isoform X2 [Protopterus annectens]